MKRRWLLVLILAVVAGAILAAWREVSLERRFIPQIRAAAARYRVDPLLVQAVVWQESRFRPGIRGSKGEIGLMQIRDDTAQEWADSERIPNFEHACCLDPGTNVMAGAYYLSKLLRRYRQTDDPIAYALADYNAGRSNVLRWNTGAGATNSALFIRQIGFPGTRKYVRSVLRRYALYQWLARLGWN